jgi:penicillin amidase
VSGALTADGNAIVANDMHLFIRVPNTWYRASMEWPDMAVRT